MRRSLAVGGVALLAACGGAGDRVAPMAGLTIVPAPGGLDVAGSGGREIGFGRDAKGALESAARVTGKAPRTIACEGTREGAALGDLVMVFEGGAFTGWQLAGRSAGTPCAA